MNVHSLVFFVLYFRGFKKSLLKRTGICWPEGEDISAGMICRRWHYMPMMIRYASGGTIYQWWYILTLANVLREKSKFEEYGDPRAGVMSISFA